MVGRLILVVIYFAVHCSCLDMCQGPFELPTIVDVLVTPVVDDTKRITEVSIKTEMVSKAPMKIDWLHRNNSDGEWIETSDGLDHFTQSIMVSGERYIFSMDLKLWKSVKNLAEITSSIWLRLDLTFPCNNVSLSFEPKVLEDMFNNRINMTTITEMPRLQYIVDEEAAFDVKVGTTDLPPGYPRESGPVVHCRHKMNRRAGQLVWPMGRTFYIADSPRLAGRTVSVCMYDVQGDTEVVYASLDVAFWFKPDYSYTISIPVELRRPGITTPAAGASASRYFNIDRRGIIATIEDTVNILCFGDAQQRPHLSVARISKEGKYEVLQGKTEKDPYLSRSKMSVTVQSPQPSQKDEYICRGTSGREVASYRFKVARLELVKMTAAPKVTMEKGKAYNLTCEAKGIPQPKMKFYWSPTFPRYMSTNASEYMKKNEAHEIRNSDYITTSSWVEGGTTYGQVTVNDIESVMSSLPSVPESTSQEEGTYEEDRSVYIVVCFAYHDFHSALKAIGHYGNKDSTLSDYFDLMD